MDKNKRCFWAVFDGDLFGGEKHIYLENTMRDTLHVDEIRVMSNEDMRLEVDIGFVGGTPVGGCERDVIDPAYEGFIYPIKALEGHIAGLHTETHLELMVIPPGFETHTSLLSGRLAIEYGQALRLRCDGSFSQVLIIGTVNK